MIVNRMPDLFIKSSRMRVYASNLATQPVPARKHKKTRSMSEGYHQRIQKKWIKRFGIKHVLGAYQAGPDCLYMHPDLIEQLRRELEQ